MYERAEANKEDCRAAPDANASQRPYVGRYPKEKNRQNGWGDETNGLSRHEPLTRIVG